MGSDAFPRLISEFPLSMGTKVAGFVLSTTRDSVLFQTNGADRLQPFAQFFGG